MLTLSLEDVIKRTREAAEKKLKEYKELEIERARDEFVVQLIKVQSLIEETIEEIFKAADRGINRYVVNFHIESTVNEEGKLAIRKLSMLEKIFFDFFEQKGFIIDFTKHEDYPSTRIGWPEA